MYPTTCADCAIRHNLHSSLEFRWDSLIQCCHRATLLRIQCSRQTDFDQPVEKWVTTFGGRRWPYYRAPRKIGSGHSNFGIWSSLRRRKHSHVSALCRGHCLCRAQYARRCWCRVGCRKTSQVRTHGSAACRIAEQSVGRDPCGLGSVCCFGQARQLSSPYSDVKRYE
jgi:hypothetical protein